MNNKNNKIVHGHLDENEWNDVLEFVACNIKSNLFEYYEKYKEYRRNEKRKINFYNYLKFFHENILSKYNTIITYYKRMTIEGKYNN